MTRFRTIVADPPWPFRWDGRAGGQRRADTPLAYELMTLEEIRVLPVADLAEDDAHLYLWVTPEHHRCGGGVSVAEAWGFKVIHEIIWAKPNFGMGAFPRHQHEPLLVARRGKLPFALRNVGSVQRWPQPYTTTRNGGTGKTHSAKPDAALDLIEQASPGPYLEMFARRARLGDWSYWGDESLETVSLSGQVKG